jgi:type II secretory pathway component PulM
VNLESSIGHWWHGLQVRERRAIAVGALLVALMLVYTVIVPRWQLHLALRDEVDSRRADLAWLADQVASVDRLRNSCSGRAPQSGSDREVVALLVRRNQTRSIAFDINAELISLRVSADSGNHILGLLGQLACEEFTLTKLRIKRSGDGQNNASFEASMELKRVD